MKQMPIRTPPIISNGAAGTGPSTKVPAKMADKGRPGQGQSEPGIPFQGLMTEPVHLSAPALPLGVASGLSSTGQQMQTNIALHIFPDDTPSGGNSPANIDVERGSEVPTSETASPLIDARLSGFYPVFAAHPESELAGDQRINASLLTKNVPVNLQAETGPPDPVAETTGTAMMVEPAATAQGLRLGHADIEHIGGDVELPASEKLPQALRAPEAADLLRVALATARGVSVSNAYPIDAVDAGPTRYERPSRSEANIVDPIFSRTDNIGARGELPLQIPMVRDGGPDLTASSPVKVTVLHTETHLQIPGQLPERFDNLQPSRMPSASVVSASSVGGAAVVHELASSSEPIKVMRLQLEPVSLGNLTVSLRRQGDTVLINIQPQHPQTAAFLRSDSTALTAVLQAAGPLPDAVSVQVSDPQSGSQSNFGPAQDNGSRPGASGQGGGSWTAQSGHGDQSNSDDERGSKGGQDEPAMPHRDSDRRELYL